MTDEASNTSTEFKTNLGQLGCFSRAGFTSDDDHLVFVNCAGDLLTSLDDRQFVGINKSRALRFAAAALLDGAFDLLGDLCEEGVIDRLNFSA